MAEPHQDRNAGEALDDRLLRVAEAADILGCSPRLVWRLREQGALEAVKIGRVTRFRRSDIRRLVEHGAPT